MIRRVERVGRPCLWASPAAITTAASLAVVFFCPIRTIAVSNVAELIRMTFCDEAVVLASLRRGFFDAPPPANVGIGSN